MKVVFEHVQRLSLRFFEKWGTGEIISRITNDIQVMQQAVQGGTVMAAVGLVNMVAFAVIMALLLSGQSGYGATPLIIVGVVTAYLTTRALESRRGSLTAPAH